MEAVKLISDSWRTWWRALGSARLSFEAIHARASSDQVLCYSETPLDPGVIGPFMRAGSILGAALQPPDGYGGDVNKAVMSAGNTSAFDEDRFLTEGGLMIVGYLEEMRLGPAVSARVESEFHQ